MDLFDTTQNLPKEEVLKRFARYIEENATVRREYAAKKYYADCYDDFANKRSWPKFYDEKRTTETIILAEPHKSDKPSGLG